MIWGLFKKMVIADNLALIVIRVQRPTGHAGWPLVLATYACFSNLLRLFGPHRRGARGARAGLT
jgi:D-alanyl-lipoteichoic acid acyltransferase DltB (MBOAT superfamily)